MLRALQTQRRRSADAGFTLIELLIVIIILGILAAIVVFSVRGISDKGDTAACKTSIETVDTAFEAYAAGQTNPSTVPLTTTLGTLVTGKYLHTQPSKIGGTSVDGTTTVAAVDAISC